MSSHPDTELPSVYYAQVLLPCTPESAWPLLLDYEAWNPGFVGATVTRIRGQRSTAGELVLIQTVNGQGERLPAIYAETVRVETHRHIAWFVYPADGSSFRNFLDFGLSETARGTRFDIAWYSLDRLAAEALPEHRKQTEAGAQDLAQAFKEYCDARLRS